jgi:phage shock protein PspC (stress-responsive transcriptional regulator)
LDTVADPVGVEEEFAKELQSLTTKSHPFRNLRFESSDCLAFLQAIDPEIAKDPVAFVLRICRSMAPSPTSTAAAAAVISTSDSQSVSNFDHGDPAQKEVCIRSVRHIHRLMPIQATCYANMTDIPVTLLSLCEKFLPPATESAPVSFCCNYRHRNNQRLDRDVLVQMVAGVVGGMGHYHVELKQPDIVILIEVMQVHGHWFLYIIEY